MHSFFSGLLFAQAADGAAATAGDNTLVYRQIATLLIVLAVMVVPFLLGGYLARRLRMPTYATRLGAVLLALIGSATVLFFGELRLGVDLRGGTILVYEIDPSVGITRPDHPEADPTRPSISSSDLLPALRRRIDPSGTLETVVRPYGESQIEVIIPHTDDREVNAVKERISSAGILQFAIVANRRDHGALIQRATEMAESDDRAQYMARDIRDAAGETIGFWARVDRLDAQTERLPSGVVPLRVDVSDAIVRDQRTGRLVDFPPGTFGGDAIAEWMARAGVVDVQVLMAVDPQLNITGEDLAYSATGYDNDGSPLVRFSLTDEGSGRFYALTLNNAPDGAFRRRLGIVLDGSLLSAPNIQQPIRSDGQISGRFTRAEVNFLVGILQAGQLPAALSKQPISENRIGATLGADTIRKGVISIGVSLVLVLIFIALYYRFAGMVACFALLLNLALIIAVMMMINQPMTLPGLAGLVLTVGMSVDANVLIFERIREELRRGAATRMAIRNGFSRATTTIVDANLTTLITAIVLYAIGTDQVRGFAVTLILGILFSMFTAIYVSRTFFDIAERYGWVSLGMSDIVGTIRAALAGESGFDFIGKGRVALLCSSALLLIGIGGLIGRGGGIFDIDFAGGSSVTFQLDQPTPADEVRRLVDVSLNVDPTVRVPFTLNRVEVTDVPRDSAYKVDAPLDDVEELKQRLHSGFLAQEGPRFVTYDVTIRPAEAVEDDAASPLSDAPAADAAAPPDEATSQRAPDGSAVRLVAAQDEEAPQTEDAPQAEEAPQANETPEAAEAEPTGEDQAAEAGEGAAAEAGTVVSEAMIRLGIADQEAEATMNAEALIRSLLLSAEAAGVPLQEFEIDVEPRGPGAEDWAGVESALAFAEWRVRLDLPAQAADRVLQAFEQRIDADPVWLSSSNIGRRVAGDMIRRALFALGASLIFIVAYIWFRFQRVVYGLAAVAALVHDLTLTLGAIAVSYWLADYLGFLLIEEFKISLTVVAALLTIIGYSLNDTIVVFDRIRETRGKSPRLTADMINFSINQTLSRTFLTSITTLIVVVLLYVFGGEGIHAFAFSLVVGVLAGTYSSVFVAAPLLLWMVQRNQPAPR